MKFCIQPNMLHEKDIILKQGDISKNLEIDNKSTKK